MTVRNYDEKVDKDVDVAKDIRLRRTQLTDLTPNNVGQLRKLNTILFPVRFGERWYKNVLHEDVREICKFGLFNDIPVANVCCRFESDATSGSGDKEDVRADSVKVYIMTLGCLAPYRRLGIASKLLDHVLTQAGPGKTVHLSPTSLVGDDAKPSQSSSQPKGHDAGTEKRTAYVVSKIYLHVQTNNEEARAFYERHGFTVTEKVDGYYKVGITPRSAWILEKSKAAKE